MEAGAGSSVPIFPLFPPHLLSVAIVESKVDHATKARLSTLSSGCISSPDVFDDEIRRKWSVIAAEPDSPLSFNGYGQIWETLQYSGYSLQNQFGDPVTPALLKSCCRWCEILEFLWEKTRTSAALDLRVRSWDVLLAIGPVENIRRYDVLWLAFRAYRARYEFSADRSGFKVARLTADELVELAQTQRELIEANASRGRLFGVRMDDPLAPEARNIAIRESIISLKRAANIILPLAAKEKTDADVLNALAFALTRRFEIGHRVSDIDSAISNRMQALKLTSVGSDLWLGWADNLARAYWSRYRELSQLHDADSGIDMFEQILQAFPENLPAATGLAELLRQKTSNVPQSNAELRFISSRIIDLLENVIVRTPDTDKNMPSRLGRCAAALTGRFREDHIIQDIDIAIVLETTAANLQPAHGKSFHFKQLCENYILRYNLLGLEEDLVSALSMGRECVDTAGSDKKELADCLTQYACAQGTSYQKTQDPEMLLRAIESFRDAERLNTECSWRSIVVLENLAQLLSFQFQRSGTYEEGAEAVKLAKEAIDILRRLSGKGQHAREARCLSILGDVLRARFDRYSAQEDLDESIRAYRTSLDATDNELVEYVPRAKDLAHMLGLRYGWLGRHVDYETAQTLVDSTLDSLRRRNSAPLPREIALLLNQKGTLLLRKSVQDGEDKILGESIQSLAEAVRLAPTDQAFCHNFAFAISRRAQNNPTDEHCREATIALCDYLGTVSTYAPANLEQEGLNVLKYTAQIALARSKADPENMVFEQTTIAALKKLSEMKRTMAGDKIWAAGEAAVRLWQLNDCPAAARYINIAVQNLPQLTMLGLSRSDQLRLLESHSNLPKFSLALNILAGKSLGRSLRTFEQARSILWDRLLSEEASTSELQAHDPKLAESFENLRLRIHKPRISASKGDRIDGMAFGEPDRYKDAEDYLKILREIRSIPGLEDFLGLPAQDGNFVKYAEHGPIVVVNCVGQYGHALLVTTAGLQNLNLPDFSESLAKLLYEKMQEAIRQMRADAIEEATKIYSRVLNTLWKTAAFPILEELEILVFREHRLKNQHLPRLWWVTNGWINLLPIHAAGDFYSPGPEGSTSTCVMDRVVSSYIPSFGALNFARTNAENRSKEPNLSGGSSVIVSMPETPAEPVPDLEFANAETVAIQPLLPSQPNNIHKLPRPTRPTVLAALKTASHAHFITHGSVSASDPTLSHLTLHLLPSGKPAPLDVRSLLLAKTPHLRSVYLSACNTSATENMALKDESMHVSGAFLMLGCPEVVASRWEVVDASSPQIAADFYSALRELRDAVDDGPGVLGSARALHASLRKARERGLVPLLWGTYVHYGA